MNREIHRHQNRPLPQLHVGHGSHHGALSIFPLWVDSPRVTGLDWKASSIRTAEREGSPVVGELVLHNSTTRPVVALEGDLLKGGWQDRMLARSLLLEPFEARVAEVFCVEAGRWGARSTDASAAHEASGRRSALSVRRGDASGGSGERGGSQQSEVWQRISRFENTLGATASSSMLDHLDRSAPLEARPLDGQRGVIIGIGGRVIGAELFGNTAGLRSRWQGILAAAALDAQLAPQRRTTAHDARVFTRHLQAVTLEDGGDAGLARAVRSQQGRLRASGIVQTNAHTNMHTHTSAPTASIIHLTAFDDAHPLLENA
ncbi:hypothetical protein ESZ53_10055 [Salinibacterium sp. UTAS2018]|uniref:ARPP-1 family domain-containing protein n=1 Tax=Salinibacterium sp. UTAS2018 TaxID=2508880 RepID=UPI0010097AE5|nr:DUF6569 family protein [Salinibacterium sp. UTAS2018]QAV70748.1 hypothetical protein ESZ53_10055 [Salinibacterium sp. UTAS2018]